MSIRPLIDEAADRLFRAEDTVCLERARLVTEAHRAHADKPMPLRRALALEHVLRHMTLDLASNPVLAGNTSSRPRAWMLIPEHGFREDAQVAIEHPELKGFLDGKVPQELVDFWHAGDPPRADGRAGAGIGHLAVDLDAVVHRGLRSILDEVEARRRRDADPARTTYREAMAVALRAVIDWSHRYADEAERLAADTAREDVAACLRRVADACRRVPAEPARNLFEGLQAVALVQLAIAIEGHGLSVSVGSPDRVLAPFAPEAEADPDGAADLVAALVLKLASNAIFGRGSKTQAVTVGGADHTGRDCSNAVTLAFLDAYDRVSASDPHLFVRWHPGLDAAVREKAVAMLSRGRSMPLLVNDAPTAGGFIAAGIPEADAYEYCVIGCNELGIPGRMFDSACSIGGGFNDLALLNRTLLALEAPDEIADMASLLARLEEAYAEHFREAFANRHRVQAEMARRAPTPLTTSLMRGAAERGTDMLQAMPYRLPGLFTRGLSNAANALAAIEHEVFTLRRSTLGLLVAAMRQPVLDDALRSRLAEAPAWGNDDDRADRWAVALVALRDRAQTRVEAAGGEPRHAVCHVVRSLHHVDGRRIGTSLDGRDAGQPVGDSVGALLGTAREGPTAVLGSVLKIDVARHFQGGTNLNITLTGSQASREVIAALVAGFFGDGGQELQINVLDAARLRDARRRPERYRDLVVRVTGLSARFVDLGDTEQLELIARAEEAARR